MSKNILITGASRGIGAAIAYKFASEGYNIIICCRRDKDSMGAVADEIRTKYHVEVLEFVGDVGEEAFVSSMIEESIKHFGHIDVLVNNAGMAHIGLLSDMSLDEWNEIFRTNLTSVFLTCKYIIPHMVSRKQGNIINISSVWGNVGASCEAAYSATKGGINSLTKALGKELAPSNIKVNAIACGVIDTQMNACFSEDEKEMLSEEIPAGRFGRADEVAELTYAIANTCNYLTSQVITLDGGWQ